MNRRRLFRIAALAGLLPLALPAEDWPQFRGPYGNGVAQEDEAPLHWGPAQNVRWKAALPGPGNSSPIASHGRVFVTCAEDAGKKRNLYCFDRRTGKELWVRTVAFPIVEPTHKSNEILCSMLTRLVACDPKTGALLWFCEGLAEEKADLVYPSPVVSDGIGVAFSGWVNGPTIGFKLGGTGDVTASNRLWLEKQTQRIGSGVVVDGHVFIVNAGPGTAQCMECQTGKIRWTERLDGGESWGSVVLAAGRLYVTSRRGVTSVFRPDPEKFELLAMNDLGEPSNATPAVSNGQIFLRTDAHLFCIAEH